MFGVDDMLIGAAITGGSSFLTGSMNRDSQAETNEKQMAFNAQQSQINRDFQERMSNTAYQRGMADMKAAGLNPILAYQKGGASAPSGGQASATLTAPEMKSNPIADGINSGMALARNRQEVENMKFTADNIKADTAKKLAETTGQDAKNSILFEDLSPAQLRAVVAKLDREYYQTHYGSTARQVGTGAEETARTTDRLLNSAKKVSDIILPWKSYGTETTKSGSSWKDKLTGENHYEDTTFSRRWPHH